MTTARVIYRDDVLLRKITSEFFSIDFFGEFCGIDFFGDKADSYKRDWHNIEYEKYEKCESEIRALKAQREYSEFERRRITYDLNRNKRWWRFWSNNNEKKLKRELSKVICDIDKVNSEIKSIKADQFYNATTLVHKAINFLNKNGFILKNSNTSGSKLETHTDIWELA